jgi:hypothetical protein
MRLENAANLQRPISRNKVILLTIAVKVVAGK